MRTSLPITIALGRPSDEPTADSESKIGPYELQDFFLFHVLRFGYKPSKVAFLARHAWGNRERGPWPDLIPPESSKGFSEQEINAWKTEYDVVSTLRRAGHEVRPLGVRDELKPIRDEIESRSRGLLAELVPSR